MDNENQKEFSSNYTLDYKTYKEFSNGYIATRKSSMITLFVVLVLLILCIIYRNYEIVKKWMDNNKIDYNDNLLKYVGKNEERKDEKQLTIFDFIN